MCPTAIARACSTGRSRPTPYFNGTFTTGTYQFNSQNYTYRYYAATGNYLGVSDDGRVVVYNGQRNWNFLDVGALSEFLVTAAKAGF